MTERLVYPPNCREVTENLTPDELIRRLKALAHTFQTLGQEEGKYKEYIPLAHHLADDFFLTHQSKDVQLLVACCIADILRIFAPEAPYTSQDEIKNVFYFLIRQLHGLRDPKDAAFKRYFYLLENLAYVKSFNMCFELADESQELFSKLFQTFFSIINDEHSHKVRNYMLEVMHPLIAESDQISDELLNTVMKNIIDETKVQRNAYLLAKELVQKTSTVLQPFLQSFFNRELLLDNKSDHLARLVISQRLYEFIYALNSICPDVLVSVVPQLEYKLRSSEEKDRLGAVTLLARMFSEKGSNLARDHRQLWTTFLGRFNDIKQQVRIRCVQYAMHFLLNHPELRDDVEEALRARQHDTDENVRYEVVTAIVSTARRDFDIVATNPDILSFVKERTLDKKFKIRREAMSGLAFVYKKKIIEGDVISLHEPNEDGLNWIKNKILYGYYQPYLEDRLLVERLLNTTLVPYQLSTENRMKMLLSLVATIDEKAERAFAEIMKNRANVRRLVSNLLSVYSNSHFTPKQKENELRLSVISLSKHIPEEIKAREFLMKFAHHLEEDKTLLSRMLNVVDPHVPCRVCADGVNSVLKKLGQPIMTNLYYNTVKALLERASSVLVDDDSIKMLLIYILDLLKGQQNYLNIEPMIGSVKGLKLLHLLASTQPLGFMNPETLKLLYDCINACSAGDTDEVHSLVLSIFSVLGKTRPIVQVSPEVFQLLLDFAFANIAAGTPKVAKHSIRAILANYDQDASIDQQLGQTIEDIKKNLEVDNEFCRTALAAIGQIALLAPTRFALQIKNIISKKIVKEMLMKQKNPTATETSPWLTEEQLPDETRCKLDAMKVIGRWLVGLKEEKIMAKKTFRMLNAFITNKGDLGLESPYKLSEGEKSWLRLAAGCCMLKICQQKGVGDEFNAEQFYNLSSLVADPVSEVREHFLQKLHKGLSAGIPNNCLPLDFMGFYALCGLESNRSLRLMAKQHMMVNVQKRREYIKNLLLHGGDKATEQLPHVLPDFVLVFGIPVLAHSPSFTSHQNTEEVMRMRNCLWFILEPVVVKNENFCFTFLKNLIDAMKMKEDAVNPLDEDMNCKLWALCDLALGLVVSKTMNYETKEYLTEPRVPEIYFRTPATRSLEDNINKSYLPEEVRQMAVRKPTVMGKVLAKEEEVEYDGSASNHPDVPGQSRVRTVMQTLRDKTDVGSEDDEEFDEVRASADAGNKRATRRRRRGEASQDARESDDEPFERNTPERTYERPERRVEEREIELDEFKVPDLSGDQYEEEVVEEEVHVKPVSTRPTRSNRVPVAEVPEAVPETRTRGVKRGAKAEPVSNEKKSKSLEAEKPVRGGTRSRRHESEEEDEVVEAEHQNGNDEIESPKTGRQRRGAAAAAAKVSPQAPASRRGRVRR